MTLYRVHAGAIEPMAEDTPAALRHYLTTRPDTTHLAIRARNPEALRRALPLYFTPTPEGA